MDRALIVKKEWLDKILSNEKLWEIRSSNTNIRGRIGLIESGSGMIHGECELIHSIDITLFNTAINNIKAHGIKNWYETVNYKTPHAWVLTSAKRYANPIPYNHPQGAVIWVKINNKSLIIQKDK